MNKKKILLVSYLFAPNNRIGAVRPTKIAEYLIRDGYEVDVFTYGYTDEDSFNAGECFSRKYVINDKPVEQKEYKSFPRKKKDSIIIHKLKRHYVTYLARKREKSFVKSFIKQYESTLCQNSYDVLITSFGPLSSIEVGLYVKKKNPKIKWICDFRDPIVVSQTPELYLPFFKYMQNKACKNADKIIAVSNGYLDRICGGKYNDKAVMIPNGYDVKDVCKSNICVVNDKLVLTYVGALYGGKRDLSPVFCSISELVDEGFVDKNKIVFNYAGTEFFVAENQARAYNINDILTNNGRLGREACLNLQNSSHALVLSTWNDKREYGVFPGKFLEYMLMRKPIISVVDGNLGNSEVSQVIKEGNLGVSYEAVNKAEDLSGLKAYIYELYKCIVQSGEISYSPIQQVLDRYNYETIIKRVEDLINE